MIETNLITSLPARWKEVRFVRLVEQGRKIERIVPNIPVFEDVYINLGEYAHEECDLNSHEQATLTGAGRSVRDLACREIRADDGRCQIHLCASYVDAPSSLGMRFFSTMEPETVPIKNDAQLAVAVANAGQLLQDIQDYALRADRDDAKVRFPRGVMKTAEEYRAELPRYVERQRASSCAYAFMHLDVLWWILNRTDITLTAKEMILKSAIITLATITEAVLTIHQHPGFGAGQGFKDRVNAARQTGLIDAADHMLFNNLWDHRCKGLRVWEVQRRARQRASRRIRPSAPGAVQMGRRGSPKKGQRALAP